MAKLSAVEIAVHAAKAGWRGQDSIIAVAVALAESDGWADRAGGLWNLDGVAGGDPAGNAVKAHARQLASGWTPWATYRSNKYLLFMPTATAAMVTADVQAIVKDPAAVAKAVAPELPGVAAAQDAVDMAHAASEWASNRNNWVRVAEVILGGALLIGALVIIARPAVGAVAGGTVGTIVKGALK